MVGIYGAMLGGDLVRASINSIGNLPRHENCGDGSGDSGWI